MNAQHLTPEAIPVIVAHNRNRLIVESPDMAPQPEPSATLLADVRTLLARLQRQERVSLYESGRLLERLDAHLEVRV